MLWHVNCLLIKCTYQCFHFRELQIWNNANKWFNYKELLVWCYVTMVKPQYESHSQYIRFYIKIQLLKITVTAPFLQWNTYLVQLISLQCIGSVPLGGPATRAEASFGGKRVQIQQWMDSCEGLCPESCHIGLTDSTNPSVSSIFRQFGTAKW